jgi:D-alanine-D-alanine ligase
MLKKIAVLMGGWGSEREVSLSSGEAVYNALIELGYEAIKIDFDRDVVAKLQKIKPDVVFNALHGRFGEDGRIQGLLDILNIPYTHSGLLASAICMDKILTKRICASYDIRSPEYDILVKNDDENNKKIITKIGKPFVIKPISEGSSVGVEIILENFKFNISDYNWQYGDKIIIEKYIAGQELHVGIMDNKALGIVEVRPKKLFYDYECKYTAGMTDYIVPAEISGQKYQEAMDIALKCHKNLQLRGISRVDFILNNKDGGDNQIYLLEVNTHPGFTPNSLVPKIAKYRGIEFKEIIEYLVKSASCGLESI